MSDTEEEEEQEEEINSLRLDLSEHSDTLLQTVSDIPALEDNLSVAFNDQQTADILATVGNEVFHTHRLVLSAWSKVLQKKINTLTDSFSTDDSKYTPELKLSQGDDVTDAFHEFFLFLYSGKVSLSDENIWEVVDLAKRFCITELEHICSNFLIHSLKFIRLETEVRRYMKLSQEKGLTDVCRSSQKRLQFILKSDKLPSLTPKLDTFTDHFSSLFDDESTGDISIKLEGSIIHLHSLILCSQSEVFKRMIKESRNKEPIVFDRDTYGQCEKSCRDALRFFYTEKIDFDHTNVWPILEFATRFECDALQELCFDFTVNNLFAFPNDRNLIYCLQQAENLNREDIRGHFFQMILANFYFSVHDFTPMMSNHLLYEVLASSDLIVENESLLFKDLQPKLQELRNTDNEHFYKILTVIRFNHMTATEVKDIMDTDIIPSEMQPEIIQNAMLNRCLMWEKANISTPLQMGPRLYLNPPHPVFKTDYDMRLHLITEEQSFETVSTSCQHSVTDDIIFSKEINDFFILKQETEGHPFTFSKVQGGCLQVQWTVKNNILHTMLQFGAKNYFEELPHLEGMDVAATAVVLVSCQDYKTCTMKTFPLQECTREDSYSSEEYLYSDKQIEFGIFWPPGSGNKDKSYEISLYVYIRPQYKAVKSFS